MPDLPKRPFSYEPPQNAFKIVYEDADLIAVDKPPDLLSVPGKDEHHQDCLLTQLISAYPNVLLVHRLDMATSGVMIFARNTHAQRHLGLQFEKRIIQKTYTARVWGPVTGHSGYINLPLVTDWPNRPKQHVCFERGRNAITHWEKLSSDDRTSRISLLPITGRSHQLRVHMLAIGHPIIGDRLYAHDAAFNADTRLNLHASELSFRHPVGGAWHTVTSDCPF